MPHDCLAENGVVGYGPTPCNVMGIGIAPGRTEWMKDRRPFTGPAGKLLDGTLAATGWHREKVFLTNAYCQWEDSPTENELALCNDRVWNEIRTVDPNIILLFGDIVSEHFLFAAMKKYKRGHVYWMQHPDDTRERYWLPVYHPAAFLHPETAAKLDVADFARAISTIPLYENGIAPAEPRVVVLDTAEQASAVLWGLQGVVAVDIESSYDGLDFNYVKEDADKREALVTYNDATLLCFSVCGVTDKNPELTSYVLPGWIIKDLKAGWGMRTKPEWLMHLGLFDKAWLRNFIGEDLAISEDTLLESYSLDERGGAIEENERAVGVHGLKDLASQFLAAPNYDVKVLKASAEDLHYYNGCDTWYTRHLHPIFKERQQADNVRKVYEEIMIPGANALSEIQAYGIAIDKRVLYQIGKQFAADWIEQEETLQIEARELGWDRPDFNFNSAPQLTHFLFDILGANPRWTKFGRSSRREVIDVLADRGFPWVIDFKEWRGINHILSTYVTGVEDDIKFDGRVHPEPIMHGTRSGRLAYHKPPIQTIPKWGVNPKLAIVRKMFVPSTPEHMLIEADYRQAELWATAYLANAQSMLDALASGDAHAVTAKDIFNTDESNPQWKILRELGKMFNFGTLYNRTANAYATNMWNGRRPPVGMENIKWTKKEAQGYIDRWYEKYPEIKVWQKQVIKEAMYQGENVAKTGRKRRYWLPTFKTVNQAVNIGPQTIAHEFLFNSFVKLHWALAEFDAHALFEVHDAIVIEAPIRWADEVIALTRRIMEEPKFGIGTIPCDISTSKTSWYDLEKIA